MRSQMAALEAVAQDQVAVAGIRWQHRAVKVKLHFSLQSLARSLDLMVDSTHQHISDIQLAVAVLARVEVQMWVTAVRAEPITY
jgi:hypothetical protein